MLFMIGIERPQNDDTAWGIVVPVFDKFGYGCASAADEKSEILYRIKAAILEVAAEMVADGHSLLTLDEGFAEYRTEYPEFDEWLAIEVPVESLKGKQRIG